MGFLVAARAIGHLAKTAYNKAKAWDNTNNQGRIQKWAHGLAHTAVKGLASHIGNETLRGAVSNFADSYHKQAIANIDKDVKTATGTSNSQKIETVSGAKPAESISNNTVSNPISTQQTRGYNRPKVRGRSKPKSKSLRYYTNQ